MDFNLRPISKVCAATGDPLMPGEDCWSVLYESDGRIVREDFSAAAWPGPPDGALGHWKCQVPIGTETEKKKFDTDSLLGYFVQLCESPNDAEQDYQYVLALLLLRKKRLILDSSVSIDDQPAMRLIGTAGEGPFIVLERELSDQQIVTFQDQLFGKTAEAA